MSTLADGAVWSVCRRRWAAAGVAATALGGASKRSTFAAPAFLQSTNLVFAITDGDAPKIQPLIDVREESEYAAGHVKELEGALVGDRLAGEGEQALTRRWRDVRAVAAVQRALRLVLGHELGEQGVETVYGVIYPPQVALVGFGGFKGPPVEGEVFGTMHIPRFGGDYAVPDGTVASIEHEHGREFAVARLSVPVNYEVQL